MKIDLHTHGLPERLPDFKSRFGYGGFMTLRSVSATLAEMVRDDGTFFRAIGSNCWDPQQRLADCDAQGVDVQVVSTIPTLFSYWAKPADGLAVAQLLNDHLAEWPRDHPRRFVGLGTLPLQDPALAIAELERCVSQLGFAGVQIGSHVNGWNLSDPALFPVFEACASLGAAVFVHPWDMMGQERMGRYWLPWLVGMPAETSLAICSLIFGGVFERLPQLRVAFAHGGGAFPGTLGRIAHGFETRPDLVAVDNPVHPRAYLGRFWVDSLVHDATTLTQILALFGPERVALGSDYPFPLGEEHPGALIAGLAGLDGNTRDQLLAASALAFLARDRRAFQGGD